MRRNRKLLPSCYTDGHPRRKRGFFMTATTQQIILAVVAVTQLVAFLIACAIAFRQAHSHVGMRRLQSTLAVLRYVEDRDLSRTRWFAYEHHSEIEHELQNVYDSEFARLHAIDDQISKLSGGKLDLQSYLYPVVTLNIAGYMAEKKLIEPDVIPCLLASTFVRTWEAYRPFIEYRRSHRFSKEKRLPASGYGRYLERAVQRIM